MAKSDIEKAAAFFGAAISELYRHYQPSRIRVLDFGCGEGKLVQALDRLGYDAYGCDLQAYWPDDFSLGANRVSTISMTPYRLAYEDNMFDVAISTSVLEHAMNKEECFQEIHRVLKPGGCSMHMLPGKWYLPYEPHLYTPLANYFCPKCPQWWFGLWAYLGVRNRFQRKKGWKEVSNFNFKFAREHLSYWSNAKYRQLSINVFGNYSAPMDFYVRHAYGGYARLFCKLPFKKFTGWLSGEFRMNFIVSRKAT